MSVPIGVIFDLDQTLIDSSIAETERKRRNWKGVYELIPKFKNLRRHSNGNARAFFQNNHRNFQLFSKPYRSINR